MRSDDTVQISAKEATGLDTMLEKIDRLLNTGLVQIEEIIPYDQAGKIQKIRQ